jgi:nitrous oxidase accessory protein NosD
VTLAGQTDHSGVVIKIFEPIKIDTSYININNKYTNIGLPVTQKTEFLWWDAQPKYQTTTGSDGKWKIEGVKDAKYHIAAEKAGYGVSIHYADDPEPGTVINLNEIITLTSEITGTVEYPEDSYIVISGIVTIGSTGTLKLNAGTIVVFENNSRLVCKGTLITNGTQQKPILFTSLENNNARLELSQVQQLTLSNIVLQNVTNGIRLVNCNNITLSNIRINAGSVGVEQFNTNQTTIQNCFLSNLENGVVTENSSQNQYLKNILLDIAENGLAVLNEGNSVLTNNVFKYCAQYGLNINYIGSLNSITPIFNFNIFANDFLENNSHIRVGYLGWCQAASNNFIGEQEFIIWTADINSQDSLNFQGNYWGYISPLDIGMKIFDRQDDPGRSRPIVDYSGAKTAIVKWY